MDFDLVIVTRNRAAILRRSIPLMLAQSRLPRRLLVVDSSDDHSEVRAEVEQTVCSAKTPVELLFLESSPGIPLQRNLALQHVQSPVVFFPDDDALWFDGVADATMRVYEADEDGQVGCVAADPSPVPPGRARLGKRRLSEMEWRAEVSRMMDPFVTPIETRFLPDPIRPGKAWQAVWRECCGEKVAPPWLAQARGELCGTASGFAMTFRTQAIREAGGFDENLGRYALYEDYDASLSVLRNWLVVCAKPARVYHHLAPGRRLNGWERGMFAIVNRTYVVCKHSWPGAKVRKVLKRYLYYQVARYALQATSAYGRDRYRGAVYGLANTEKLFGGTPNDLVDRYLTICREFSAQVPATA